MIEDPLDRQRSGRGRHHGLHRGEAAPAPVMPDGLLGIRQVAVHLDESDAGRTRLDLALHLAVCLDAALLGVATPNGTWSGDAGAPPTPEKRFRAAAATRPGVHAEWREFPDDALDELVGVARLADLTILGQSPPIGSPLDLRPDRVVLACGRPCLIVPPAWRSRHVGQDVAVAWDGSREAARALADALPLLRDAGSVRVVEVGPRNGRGGPGQPGADRAVAFLERHGIQAFAEYVEAGEEKVADAFAHFISGSGVDLVVAGLFGHSPIRERLTGGASYGFLTRMTVPMLTSH